MRCVIYLRVSTREQAEHGEGEEGFSIPAQREACVRHIRDKGWDLVDEYADRGESARSADRPQLQQMLARIAEDGDVDAVVVHKIDRLARNMEDHVAIRALLRRRSVTLVSVTENLEETASGRLVEGIHALMAEFYSANLASEIKKGMSQKAKMGGWPHAAPLGYTNVRETIGSRQVAHIVIDPERGPHITCAFELYSTGEWTLERLVQELAHRGLRNRGRRDRPVAPIGVSALANILANKAYAGIVTWEGIEYPGLHQPLTDTTTFNRVQDLLAARAARGTRERRHNHYLTGTLFCGVCGRGLSFQLAKGHYEYLYCLGQKNRNPTGCQEPYMPAGDLEAHVEQLYEKIELPKSWRKRLREELEAEITARQHRNAAEREFLTRKLAKADTERRKLLDAYYAGAIDVTTLKTEQARIATDVRGAEERLAAVDAHLAEWQEILETAMRFATNCAKAYARASAPTRRRFNQAVFTRIDVRDGKIADIGYHPPFDLLFSSSEFEYGDLVDMAGLEQRGARRGRGARSAGSPGRLVLPGPAAPSLAVPDTDAPPHRWPRRPGARWSRRSRRLRMERTEPTRSVAGKHSEALGGRVPVHEERRLPLAGLPPRAVRLANDRAASRDPDNRHARGSKEHRAMELLAVRIVVQVAPQGHDCHAQDESEADGERTAARVDHRVRKDARAGPCSRDDRPVVPRRAERRQHLRVLQDRTEVQRRAVAQVDEPGGSDDRRRAVVLGVRAARDHEPLDLRAPACEPLRCREHPALGPLEGGCGRQHHDSPRSSGVEQLRVELTARRPLLSPDERQRPRAHAVTAIPTPSHRPARRGGSPGWDGSRVRAKVLVTTA